jgi:hypothetical protein
VAGRGLDEQPQQRHGRGQHHGRDHHRPGQRVAAHPEDGGDVVGEQGVVVEAAGDAGGVGGHGGRPGQGDGDRHRDRQPAALEGGGGHGSAV